MDFLSQLTSITLSTTFCKVMDGLAEDILQKTVLPRPRPLLLNTIIRDILCSLYNKGRRKVLKSGEGGGALSFPLVGIGK